MDLFCAGRALAGLASEPGRVEKREANRHDSRMWAWRILRGGLVYLTFAAATSVASHLVTPIHRRLAGAEADPELIGQLALHRAARFLRWLATGVGAVSVEYDGVEALAGAGPLVLVANHPTNLDAVFLIAALPQLDTVVEAAWAQSPVIRGTVKSAGYLSNDEPRRLVEEASRRLAAGRLLLVFPEGSRSPASELHEFQRGAARMALAAACPLQTVVIQCDPPFGLKGRPWYDIPKDTPQMSIRVGRRFSVTDSAGGGEVPSLVARRLTRALREYFVKELNYGSA